MSTHTLAAIAALSLALLVLCVGVLFVLLAIDDGPPKCVADRDAYYRRLRRRRRQWSNQHRRNTVLAALFGAITVGLAMIAWYAA